MSVAVGLAVRVVRLGYKPEGHGAENDSWLAGSSIDEGHCGSLWWGGDMRCCWGTIWFCGVDSGGTRGGGSGVVMGMSMSRYLYMGVGRGRGGGRGGGGGGGGVGRGMGMGMGMGARRR